MRDLHTKLFFWVIFFFLFYKNENLSECDQNKPIWQWVGLVAGDKPRCDQNAIWGYMTKSIMMTVFMIRDVIEHAVAQGVGGEGRATARGSTGVQTGAQGSKQQILTVDTERCQGRTALPSVCAHKPAGKFRRGFPCTVTGATWGKGWRGKGG